MSTAAATIELPRGAIQEGQYAFPYHHLAQVDGKAEFCRHRTLSWGHEYLCYLHHAQEIVRRLAPHSVLEVGCGDGRFIGMLSDCVDRRVGVDISERAIAFAGAFHPEVEFRAMDAAELDEQFDLVAAIEVLEHIPDGSVDSFLRTLSDRTIPGGNVLISVPTTVKKLQPKHYRHYTVELLEEQIRNANVPLVVESVDHVYRQSFWVKFVQRATCNRLWSVHVSPLETLMWRHVWHRLRHADPTTGMHLMVILKRTDEADNENH